MNNSTEKKYKILLTNDDGFYAEGLQCLARALKNVAEIFILAPDSNRSGVSSHIEMNVPLTVKKVKENQFTTSGYPCDCVITALRSTLFEGTYFDAVLSGINKGPNMGTDCIYSGTIAAARQAVLYGIPGIALSVKSSHGDYSPAGYDYTGMADFVSKNLGELIDIFKTGCVLSLNALSAQKYKKAEFARLCTRDYQDRIEFEELEEGILKSSFFGGNLTTFGPENNEYDVVNSGSIAITRLFAEPVDFPSLENSVPDFCF